MTTEIADGRKPARTESQSGSVGAGTRSRGTRAETGIDAAAPEVNTQNVGLPVIDRKARSQSEQIAEIAVVETCLEAEELRNPKAVYGIAAETMARMILR
jgi:hypothetical protein